MLSGYSLENTRFYVNKHYEKEIDSINITRHYHYIYGDNGVVALHIANSTNNTDSMYYVHTDHLGSYCAITNPSKKLAQRNYFDPWGNMPKIFFGHYQRGDTLIIGEAYLEGDSISMSEIPNLNFSLTNRGFTGHEHYPYFKIINMNGRLYDPVIGRFFSPDKYVANSSFTQDFNRYSYCRNNPLMYTDPSGEFIQYVIGGVVGLISGLMQGGMIADAKGATGGERAKYMIGGALIGSVIGAATGGLGGVISSALPVGGCAAGAITGAVSGTLSGATSSLAMGALAGLKGNDLWGQVGKGAAIGFFSGAIMGGIMGGIEDISTSGNGEVGGSKSTNPTFLDETIPPGHKPTRTGEIAETATNPNYGQYGMTRNGGTKGHYGVDYLGEVGDPVQAMYDGRVTRIGSSSSLGKYNVRTSSLIDGTRYNIDYGHMSSATVVKGQNISAGDLVGLMGREGIQPAYPTHVHIQVSRSVIIQSVRYTGYVQPSWNYYRNSTIPWQLRLTY